MLRYICSLIILFFSISHSRAQCSTEYNKIIPDTHTSQNNGFGHATARYGDYLAVADPWNDTLAMNGGAVFIYELEVDHWKLIATLLPSNPEYFALFGFALTLTENYLFVGARNSPDVYVYSKDTQWQSKTEDQKISSPTESDSFGRVIKVRSDEEKLLISEEYTGDGVVYCYTKPTLGWAEEPDPPQPIVPPSNTNAQSQRFGASVEFENEMLVIGAPDYNYGIGRVYVFQDQSGGSWDNFQLQAKLDSSYPEGYSPEFGENLQLMHENIFVQAQGLSKHAIFHFKPQADWADMKADTVYYLTDSLGREGATPLIAHDSSLLVLSTSNNDSIVAHTFSLTSDNMLTKATDTTLYAKSAFDYFPAGIHVDLNGNLSLGFMHDPSNKIDDGIFWTVPKKDSGWGFENRNTKSYVYHTASEDYFGAKLLKVDNYLFVGAPDDDRVNKGYGSVQIYQKSAEKWEKIHEIIADSATRKFGSSIQFQNDSLYIGSDSSINIFQKGASWADWTQVEKIVPPGSLFKRTWGFGTHISFSKSVMATMAIVDNSYSRGIRNSLFIYEKGAGGWEYKQNIILREAKKIQDILASPIDVLGETILITDYEAYIVEKDDTGNWDIRAKLSDNSRNYLNRFAHSVILTDSLAYVGAMFANRGVRNSGAVYVFERDGENWVDSYEPIVIEPSEKSENMHFGAAIQLFDNKLAVGAHRSQYFFGLQGYTGDQASQSPGSVYIFEALNADWSQHLELGQINGDTSQVDNMYGINLVFDQEGLLVGAPYDSDVTGSKSGAIYHTPITAFPSITVDSANAVYCALDTLIRLEAAVPGGTWSGPGIVDANTGTFNPSVGDVGVHELTYTVPCTYLKHLTVEITPSFSAEYQHATVYQLCESGTVALSISATDSVSYQWFYLPKGEDVIQEIADSIAQIDVSDAGKYWVEVSNSCTSQQLDTIYVSISQPPVIKTPDQKFACFPYSVVSIQNFSSDYDYQLLQQRENGTFQFVQAIESTEVVIENAGVYQVRSSVGVCEWLTDPFSILERLDELTILPLDSTIIVCSGDQWLEAPLEENFRYTWYFSEEQDSQPIEVGNTYRVKAGKTGYYALKITYAQCEWTSKRKQVIFQEPTVLEEVANIFTPNGDGVNDTFGIPLRGVIQYNLSIFNRQGKLAFQTDNPAENWNGGRFPSTVYLWVLHYQNSCDNEPITRKGFISLMRGK